MSFTRTCSSIHQGLLSLSIPIRIYKEKENNNAGETYKPDKPKKDADFVDRCQYAVERCSRKHVFERIVSHLRMPICISSSCLWRCRISNIRQRIIIFCSCFFKSAKTKLDMIKRGYHDSGDYLEMAMLSCSDYYYLKRTLQQGHQYDD